jgi:HEAT repeat protein
MKMNSLRKLAARNTLTFVLCCSCAISAVAQGTSEAQTADDRAAQVANAVAKVRSGQFNGYHVEMIAEGRAVEAIPDLEKQFTLTSDPLDKAKIAQVLLYLGDKKDLYWDYLAELAKPAVESDAPDPGLYDAQGKPIQGLSQEFIQWAKLHNESPVDASTKAVYEWPGIVMLVGGTGDPRAVPLLRRALSSPNSLIASAAVDGLAQMQDVASVPSIIARCEKARPDEAAIIAESLVYFDDPDAQASFKTFVPANRATLLRQKRMSRRGPLNDN